jgi:long-chain acyl-CoA synthetase
MIASVRPDSFHAMPISGSLDISEFLIADLSLAAQSIPSFTLTSPSLLSLVLQSHPPSAIITTIEFLPHVLELIYDSAERGHHTIIVTGGTDLKGITQAKNVNILRFSDIENDGAKGDKIVTPAPGPFLNSFMDVSLLTTGMC